MVHVCRMYMYVRVHESQLKRLIDVKILMGIFLLPRSVGQDNVLEIGNLLGT